MDVNLQAEDFQTPAGGAVPALLFHLHEDDPELARLTAAQQLLFPASPRLVCHQLGLTWWAATKLYEDGWLSFSPEHTPELDEAQEAELRFIGSLALAGCDRAMLGTLLSGLTRPYAYDLKRLYFDWVGRRWRLLPNPQEHPEAAFTDWLETLVHSGDTHSLSGIGELAQDALSRVQQSPSQVFAAPAP